MNAIYVWFTFLLKYRSMLTADGEFDPLTKPLVSVIASAATDNSYQMF